jgi:hypothetical protein
MSEYYYIGIEQFVNDYKNYVKLRQKLNSYRDRLNIYKNLIETLYFSNYQIGSKHKVLEFDILNIFKRHLNFNSINDGPKVEKISKIYEKD